ncbi:type IV secretion system DNA-binding domain-containing protein [Novosphingobium pentaromativorans]|uniref:Type IV secretory pathway VirD4 components-like protein n=1 Tax=Novosphingobium pentaromativorans US6-1 TaxID=1088721 RepID=G6EF32_9SPHN|nr:type IV secretion system DNA-binding domain-containing protein [Novosphingobium pentaromativorans]AIT79240.1 conjugal transfer protein TraD [Novosphingobium pentaromativorans US6-1]EHJ60085.1 type IV secretory pathway VirD4 components-like protein [Novosphingobium pentaromativorans US6-1]
MKRNLVNFTRGSQLLGHFSFMFAAGLKGPLIIAAIGISWTSWWTISAGLSDHETYLVWMRIYAAIYGFMEFDPAKQVALETGFGGTVQLPIIMLDAYPPVIRAWDHLLDLLGDALVRSALLLVPAFVLFYWFAARFGSRSKERKHERGAMLVTLPELVDELRGHNQRERARELSSAMGWKWHLCSPKELSAAFPYRPSHLATVVYPWRLEQSHAMLIGTTGMGKTVAMSDMIAEARAKGQRCVVFDLTGAFVEHFYQADRDIILNPLDARCPQWSLFDECRTEGEFWAAAEALVPHDGGGEAQFWVIAARALFVEFCLKLVAEGRGTNAALARELMTADLSRVHAMMRGTIADPLTAPEAARMAESIRAVFNVNAKALKLLPTSGHRFSVRDWIEEGAHDDEGTNAKRSGSMVFISARYVDMSVCAQLLTLWLDTAMNTLMTMPRTKDLKCWFFIDELGALHRLPALEKGLQTARNFGGAIVTGIHAYAKLKEVYGENMAMTLASLARTKLILGTADRETATWCSDFIGHRQVRDMEEGYTYGYNNARDAVSLTPRKHIEPLLLPDQLMNLPRLSGFIKFPDGFPAAPVRLKPIDRERIAHVFVGRAKDREPIRQVEGKSEGDETAANPPASQSEHPSSNDDGAGKPVVPKQGTLPLESAVDVDAKQSRQRVAKQAEKDVLDDTRKVSGKSSLRRRSSPEGRAATPRNSRPLLPTNATLRKGDHPDEKDPSNSVKEGRRSDLPRSNPPSDKPQAVDRIAQRQRETEARKLMLEDGVPEQDQPSHEGPDLGDFEL